ncbi:MAG TPA: type IV pilus secretin PilQ family protein [Leucothrix mucor]|uniref:Type IV pilus secretin PilQ family protein n=1 Tax=Leucothrix mucor TaxID=45248 RepID=A0A7V2T1T7_LEUMU|nr:type IV pilus secretin PilQ family protein [Leucothrix mucor]
MKTFKHALFALALPVFILAGETCQATSSLQTINAVNQGDDSTILRFHFDDGAVSPKSFMMKFPQMLVLDFPDTLSATGLRNKIIQSNVVKSVKIARASGKLRVMVSLKRSKGYTTKIVGNDVVVLLSDKIMTVAKARPQRIIAPVKRVRPVVARRVSPVIPRPVAQAPLRDANKLVTPLVRQKSVSNQAMANNYIRRPKPKITPYRYQAAKVVNTARQVQQRSQARVNANMLGRIDFRRENNGDGRVVIPMPNGNIEVKAVKKGNRVSVVLKNVRVNQASRRLNVLDFATPASYIDITRHGANAQVDIAAGTSFEFETLREGRNFIIIMKKTRRIEKKRAAAKKLLKPKKKAYTGKKLSLNFQDIEIRSVLQLLADFTDKNIVVSDSVKGNITLRLKNVPWDQALDIVLESKALGMRNNGNVIWVAPASELAAKEQQELQSLKRIKELEPLVTEYISVNYARAEDLIKLVKASKGDKDGTLLSNRGTISVDTRTNTLLVQDTVSRIDSIREMVKSLDIPIRQVSIESRIVIANDEFGKDLGTRFGVTKLVPFGSRGLLASSGSSSALNSINNQATGSSPSQNLAPVKIPALGDRLNVNMPIAGAAGKFGFSILARDFLIDLELSALQAENKGEVVSTPRVVTANKKSALIEQGVEIPYLEASSSGATSVSFKKAVLSLEVTPQITPDNHVIMDLKVNQDTVGAVFSGVPSINTREVKTQVIVESGQTVVLGGVHEEQYKNDVQKVPFLGDLPYVGRLFKRSYKKDDKRELLIFVTPRVLD